MIDNLIYGVNSLLNNFYYFSVIFKLYFYSEMAQISIFGLFTVEKLFERS